MGWDGMASFMWKHKTWRQGNRRAQGIFSNCRKYLDYEGDKFSTSDRCAIASLILWNSAWSLSLFINFFGLISIGFPTCWKNHLPQFFYFICACLLACLLACFFCRFTSILIFLGMFLHQTVIEFHMCAIVLLVKNGPIWSLTSGSLHSNWGDRPVNPSLKYIDLSVLEITYLRYQENLQNWFKKEEKRSELEFLKNE